MYCYFYYLEQYSCNLITWERSDHNLITFNLRNFRKLNLFIYTYFCL